MSLRIPSETGTPQLLSDLPAAIHPVAKPVNFGGFFPKIGFLSARSRRHLHDPTFRHRRRAENRQTQVRQ